MTMKEQGRQAATFAVRAAQCKALGHPVRLRIAAGLLRHACAVGRIVEQLRLPQSTVSQHLAVLRTAGIIVPERHGSSVCYRVLDPAITRLLQQLAESDTITPRRGAERR